MHLNLANVFLVVLAFFSCGQTLHPRNAFQGSYDMDRLSAAHPALRKHIIPSTYSKGGRATINFADQEAVRAINAALLKTHYGIRDWEEFLPAGKLIPPVPGRADYLHHIADTIRGSAGGKEIPKGSHVVGLDIGTGASVIYPLLGASAYGWKFIGSECNEESFVSAQRIVSANAAIRNDIQIDVRFQASSSNILNGVLKEDEMIDFVMCNPPFFESEEHFRKANARKQTMLAANSAARGVSSGAVAANTGATRASRGGTSRGGASRGGTSKHKGNRHSSTPPSNYQTSTTATNLSHASARKLSDGSGLAVGSRGLVDSSALVPSDSSALVPSAPCGNRRPSHLRPSVSSNNFGGDGSELWCPGGEVGFIKRLAEESQEMSRVATRCLWFSSLVSRSENLPKIQGTLQGMKNIESIEVIKMAQGSKTSQIVMWTYVERSEHAAWCAKRPWSQGGSR